MGSTSRESGATAMRVNSRDVPHVVIRNAAAADSPSGISPAQG
jgi:hypothetical protein